MSSKSIGTYSFGTYGDPVCFVDFPQENANTLQVFTPSQFKVIFDLLKNVSEAAQETVITIFKNFPELSKRHFKIIWDQETAKQRKKLFPESYNNGAKREEIRTFFHQACINQAEKVVNWYCQEFTNHDLFSIPSKKSFETGPQLETPLLFHISHSVNNEISARISHILLRNVQYKITKNCIYLDDKSPRIVGYEEINKIKKTKSHVHLADLIVRQNKVVNALENVVFRAARMGKSVILEGILAAFSRNTSANLIHQYSQMPLVITSIVQEYSPFIVPAAIQDIVTSRSLEQITISTSGIVFKYFEILSPFKEVLNGLKRYQNKEISKSLVERYIETAELLNKLDNSPNSSDRSIKFIKNGQLSYEDLSYCEDVYRLDYEEGLLIEEMKEGPKYR